MRTSRWILVAILSLLFVLGPAGTAWAQSYEPEELQFLELINQYRQENGLEPLLLSTPLSVASEHHSEDMGTYGFFSHTTEASSYYPVGADHTVRIAQEGYDYNTYTAENLAYGQTSAEEVFEAWRTSPEHNVNMLGDYAVIGIGLVWTDGVPYWTTDFGAYVDPSATGSSSNDTSGNDTTAAPDATATDQETAPKQTADGTTADSAPSADQGAKKQAAEDQYTQKPARNLDPPAAEDKQAASSQYTQEKAGRAEYADPTAPEDQYSQDPPDTTAVNQGKATAANVPAPQASAPASAPTTRSAALNDVSAPASTPTELLSAPRTDGESGSSADTAQVDPAQTDGTAEPISVLPDTGGLPLFLTFGGTLLAGCALMVARRIFQG